MNWIAVHDNVTGSKLRGLRKKLNCSEIEAVGVLVILWLWARKDAEPDGIIHNADLVDIENVFETKLPQGLVPKDIVSALEEEGWIDKSENGLYIHDWEEWQAQSYAHEEKKIKDRERQREYRAKKKALAESQGCHSDSHSDSHSDNNGDTPKPPKPPKKVKVEEPKKKFADFVNMKESEHKKLISLYGEPFTEKCIDVLDNYKGSSGKKYKDDYRAILTWVVDKVKKENPGLVRTQQAEPVTGNPFRK